MVISNKKGVKLLDAPGVISRVLTIPATTQFASGESKFLRYARVNERRFYDQSIGNSWVTAGAVRGSAVESMEASRNIYADGRRVPEEGRKTRRKGEDGG